MEHAPKPRAPAWSVVAALIAAPLLLVWNIVIAVRSGNGAFADGTLGFREFIGLLIPGVIYWVMASIFLVTMALAFHRHVLGDHSFEMPRTRGEEDGDDVEPHQHWLVAAIVSGVFVLILGHLLRTGG